MNLPKGTKHRSGVVGVVRIATCAALLAAMAPAATAQTVTGAAIAQELQRQIERDRALREQQETAPDVRLQAPATTDPGRLPEGETPCFPIHEIVLKSELPDFAWAKAAADPADDPASGRCLGSAGINLVMARVNMWGQTRINHSTVRDCTHKGWALGGKHFQDKIERLSQRRAMPLPKGRPKTCED